MKLVMIILTSPIILALLLNFARPSLSFDYLGIHRKPPIRHVDRSVGPIREAKPHSGAALEHSAHDCVTRLLVFVTLLK